MRMHALHFMMHAFPEPTKAVGPVAPACHTLDLDQLYWPYVYMHV